MIISFACNVFIAPLFRVLELAKNGGCRQHTKIPKAETRLPKQNKQDYMPTIKVTTVYVKANFQHTSLILNGGRRRKDAKRQRMKVVPRYMSRNLG